MFACTSCLPAVVLTIILLFPAYPQKWQRVYSKVDNAFISKKQCSLRRGKMSASHHTCIASPLYLACQAALFCGWPLESEHNLTLQV